MAQKKSVVSAPQWYIVKVTYSEEIPVQATSIEDANNQAYAELAENPSEVVKDMNYKPKKATRKQAAEFEKELEED